MALTDFQRDICRRLADHRIASGESYVAGGVALNELLAAPRESLDIDLFHDTDEALESTWRADRRLLEQGGFSIRLVRERPSFIEAEVAKGGDTVIMQWVRDSAYRFFPLVEHPELGLTLHPFDLATNEVLALVGRLEVRDWVDVIECHNRLQQLGYLCWAACGKDPGFGPSAILEIASASHYSADEVRGLAFADAAPDPAALSRRWREILEESRRLVELLPLAHVGKCVLDRSGELYRARPEDLAAEGIDALRFHEGRVRGALPTVRQDT